ncbi:MAG: ChuX/HutX family heme-like substrate-binding protein [Chthoniobacteraceae bacterium]
MNEASSSERLIESWRKFRAENPTARIRNAAVALDVGEAQLLATQCGAEATRLSVAMREGGWGAVLQRIPELGRVMALTRNEHCVHERKGNYRDVGIFGTMGSVVGPDIDLRFFLNQWHLGFAVREETAHGTRESLQFFNLDGSAIHKIYLQEESDRTAFATIVEEFKSGDQSPEQAVEALDPKQPDRPDSEIDVPKFVEGWRGLQDTHEFFGLLKTHEVGRMQALRLAGEEFAKPLDPAAGETLLRAAAEQKLPIMVFVGNPGMIQIHTGAVERIAPHEDWINVLDPDFNLHLRRPAIRHGWAVRKPTSKGHVTSVELYDAAGEMIVQFFGRRKPGQPELEGWRNLVGELPGR